MNQKAGQQPDVLEAISQHLASSEEKRRKLRFAYNLKALSRNSLQVLDNDEFIADLSRFIVGDSGERQESRETLIVLGRAVVSPERTIRERTLAVLSLAAQQAIDEQDHEAIVLLVNIFSSWLEFEREPLPGLAVIIKRLQELVGWLLLKSFWQDAEDVLQLLARIYRGGLEKSPAIRSLVSKSLNILASQGIIENLADNCLQHKNEHLCQDILEVFGNQAAEFLLQKLTSSSQQEERQVLLRLLSNIAGDGFAALMENFLRHELSAEVLKDLISFVAERREETLFPSLRQHFCHEDRRVQKEMIGCVVKLGGKNLKERLLTGLQAVDESLKISIIRLLAEYNGGDDAVLTALCTLVEARRTFTPNGWRKLVGAVSIALRAFPRRKSIEMLRLLQNELKNDREDERLLLQIDRSLKILTPQLRHNRQLHEAEEEVVFDSDPLQDQSAFSKVAKIEEEIKKLLRRGDSKGAGLILFQYARAAGRERDFATAEKLRDRILEVDPMALADVVELGEWLEGQRNAVAESLPLEVWGNLGGSLSPEEFKALQQGLRRENYSQGDILVEAGESDESLYFLTSGHIGLTCLSGREECFLKRMKPGDILGSAQFFTASVWTVSLKALSDVQVHLLKLDSFHLLAEKFPELEQKLHHYCAEYEKMIAQLLKTSGDDRREFPRYQTSWLISNCLQDSYGGKDSRNFTGKLADISRSGLSFTVKISDREHARLLLGREIASVIKAAEGLVVRCSGMVVGVRLQNALTRNFSVHVKLAGKMDDATLQQIVSLIA